MFFSFCIMLFTELDVGVTDYWCRLVEAIHNVYSDETICILKHDTATGECSNKF